MLRELKTLMAVAQEGTFAAAGERIGLTQAAVSAQMKRLEADLGFDLFDRTGRLACLTPRGEQTLEQAVELLRLYDQLGSQQGDRSTTTISIGAITSVQRSRLPQVLASFHTQYANSRTRVVPGVSLQLLDQVDAGELDMAAVIRPPFSVQRDLHWTTLAREPFRLLVPRNEKCGDWAELLAHRPFIRYDRVSFGGRQVDRFLRAQRANVQDICEVDEIDVIVSLVAAGLGVALVPQTAAQGRWPAAVRALGLGHHTFHREIGLIHRANRFLSEPAQLLAKLLCAAYGALDHAASQGR